MGSTPRRFEPTLASLRAHEAPPWYHDAKLGIFVHWTMAAVPAFAPRDHDINELLRTRYDDMQWLIPYVEWYENSLRFPESPVSRFHREHYGDRPYASFREDFERGGIAAFDADAWAEAFRAAGARYVVFVTKHHDGYCLWPSRVANPRRPGGWRSPRDCVGELARAVRARGMRFGVYYSGGLDWTFQAMPLRDMGDVIGSVPGGDYPPYAEAQVRELIERVAPDVLWNDIAWPAPSRDLWRLFADYYAAVPEGLVNDRWYAADWPLRAMRLAPVRKLFNAMVKRAVRRGGDMTPPRPPHCDARTPEYAVFTQVRREKWECVRGIDKSFGYNRFSRDEDFLGHAELVHSFADIVSKNGNLLLNVGPRGDDAVVPDAQLERLRWLGAWLATNGEAVYGTRPWTRAAGTTRDGVGVRFTAASAADGRPARVHAIVLGAPRPGPLRIADFSPRPDGVFLLGHGALAARVEDGDLAVEWPAGLASAPAYTLACEVAS